MKSKRSNVLIGFLLVVFFSSTLHAATVPAPKGWNEEEVNQVRILTKGKTIVEIGPWLNINGMKLDARLQSMEKIVPDAATFVSSKGVIKESLPGLILSRVKSNTEKRVGNRFYMHVPAGLGLRD